MAPIQKAIRDLERCIKKKVGKGESTEALDKKLALLYDDKTISDQIQKEKRNSAKYHMIKFVERQKLVRKIRSLDQQIAAAQDIADNTALNASRIDLMEKLAYVLYYPKELKYVALFAETEGDTVGKNEKLRLRAHNSAVQQWKDDKSAGVQDRVMRVILGEEKECVEGADRSHRKREHVSEEGRDQETDMSKGSAEAKGSDFISYGDKMIAPKKKKQKVEKAAEKVAVIEDDFLAGKEPDSFFLEEEIIESKNAAQQSINMKYPPERKQYNNNSKSSFRDYSRTSTPYGSYGPGKGQGHFDKNRLQNSNKKPLYGQGTFSSFAPSKQSARLQKWQERKSHR
jgi:hypothetical protein